MKTQSKNNREIQYSSDVIINPDLEKYEGKILFPQKLELAEKQLKGIDVSAIKNYQRK